MPGLAGAEALGSDARAAALTNKADGPAVAFGLRRSARGVARGAGAA